MELTILMPCLNEAETLKTCVMKARSFLESNSIDGEILIADNGSTDGSQRIAQEAGARVVNVSERGYGAAIHGGILAALGEYVIVGDADDSYDFSDLSGFLSALRGGDDLVMGNRFRGGIQEGAMPPLHQYLGTPVISLIGRLFFKAPIGDFNCGLRGFRRKSVLDLNISSPGMEFASEMIAVSALNKLRISEVPTKLYPDGRSRKPHLRTWRDGWRHLRLLLMLSPRWLFLYPGLTLVLLGAFGAFATGFSRVTIGSVNFENKTFYCCCLMLLLGVQVLTFGALTRLLASRLEILPPTKTSQFINRVIQEDILIVVGVLAAAGLGTVGYCVYYWASIMFQDIYVRELDRLLMFGITLIAISVQLFFSSFLYTVISKIDARK